MSLADKIKKLKKYNYLGLTYNNNNTISKGTMLPVIALKGQSHFKMLITQPRSKTTQNGPRTSLMGPGGVVWGKNQSTKN